MSSPAPDTSPPATNTTTSPPPSATATPPPTTITPAAPPPSSPPPPSPSTPPPTPSPPPSTTPSPPPSTPSPPPSIPPPDTSPPPPSPPSPPGTISPPPPPPKSHSKSPPLPPHSPRGGAGTGGGDGGGNPTGSGGNSGISTGVVVAIAIAGVVVLLVITLICVCFSRNKKRRRRRQSDDFSNDVGGGGGYYVPTPPPQPHHTPPPPKDGHYGTPVQHWQQSYPPPAEHYQVSKPPPVPGPARPPPRGPSPQLTPGHAPFISSGGGSGSSVGSENILPPPSPGIALGFSRNAFSYDELAIATKNFSDANVLGQGGFGYVHKGTLPNGKEVAVKSLKAGSGQGEREFQAEVEIISRVHHKHLVSLVGYCITGSHRLLVYEFVSNSTMEFHLHGKGQPVMDWSTRLRIALGSAKGLAYLHEDCHPKIIHRDIKAANILLNDKFEAMVADFGLAKFSSDTNTHVSTRVMGTFGYLAPEYAASGKLTDKSDVFSFGVMLLELITGRRPVDSAYTYMDDSLVDWARPLLTRALEENNFESLADPRLENNYNPIEMGRMVACASACVRHSARRRPPMSKVVRALEGEVSLSDLNEGVRPGNSSMYTSHGSSDYDTTQYKDDLKKFRQVALASQEYGSSEYGATTSEYGVNPSGSSSEAASHQTTREMEMGKMKGENQDLSKE